MISYTHKKGRKHPKVVILGVGNILLKDEGVGVRVIERLEQEYHFPKEVELIDGGTAGPDLLPIIRNATHLIIVDAIHSRQKPGSISRLTPDELAVQIPPKASLHQLGLLEALHIARTLDGRLPHTVIIGIEPEDASGWGMELTPCINSSIPQLIALILQELTALDITAEKL